MPLILQEKKTLIYENELKKYENDHNFLDAAHELTDYIKNYIDNSSSKLLLLLSGTGSGKSTYLLTTLYDKTNKILLSEPSISTTITITNDIVKYGGDKFNFGKNIGYITGDAKLRIENKATYLKLCTHGVLNAEMDDEENFSKKYDYVFLDEVHKDQPESIEAFKKIKEIIKRKDSPTFVLMSGTMDTEKYRNYFGVSASHVVKVVERDSFNIIDVYNDENKSIVQLIEACLKLETEAFDRNHILVFLHSTYDIKNISKNINKFLNKNNDYLLIKVTSATMSEKGVDYNNLVNPLSNQYKRKIVLATNAIETGATFPFMFCIDGGLSKENKYHPIYNLNILIDGPIDKFSSKQRRGRVGRIQEWYFYPVYSKRVFDKLKFSPYFKLVTNDAHKYVLKYISNFQDGASDIYKKILTDGNLVTLPIQSFITSFKHLYNIGCIEYKRDKIFITECGHYALKIRRLKPQTTSFLYHALLKTTINIDDLITCCVFLEDAAQLKSLINKNLNVEESDRVGYKRYVDMLNESKNTLFDLLMGYDLVKKDIIRYRLGFLNEIDFNDKYKLNPKTISNFIVFEGNIKESIVQSGILERINSPVRIKLKHIIKIINNNDKITKDIGMSNNDIFSKFVIYFDMLNSIMKLVYADKLYIYDETKMYWVNKYKNINGVLNMIKSTNADKVYLLDEKVIYDNNLNNFAISSNLIVE